MSLHIVKIIICSLTMMSLGCGDGAGGPDEAGAEATGSVSSCEACESDAVCVRTTGEPDTFACAPMPEACGGSAQCADQACAAALLDLCADEILNTGCTDSIAPAVVSCNP